MKESKYYLDLLERVNKTGCFYRPMVGKNRQPLFEADTLKPALELVTINHPITLEEFKELSIPRRYDNNGMVMDD